MFDFRTKCSESDFGALPNTMYLEFPSSEVHRKKTETGSVKRSSGHDPSKAPGLALLVAQATDSFVRVSIVSCSEWTGL